MAKGKKKKDKIIDSYLSRSSHISQIVLVALAIFGYFYTVRPVYQNQLLAEEVSKKETRLNQLQKEIDNFNPQMQTLRDKQTGLELEIKNLQETKTQAELQVETIQAEKKSLELSINQTKKQLTMAQADVNLAYKKIYIESFDGAVLFEFIRHNQNKSSFDILNEKDKASTENYFLTPYDAIHAVLQEGNPQTLEISNIVPQKIRDKLNNSIRTILEEHKHNLSRPLTDINTIINAYETEIEINKTNTNAEFKIGMNYAEKLNAAYQKEMKRASDFLDQFY